ncbi:hypothetical protein [Rugosimonospora acidiphila]
MSTSRTNQSGSARLAPRHDPDQLANQGGSARLAPRHDPDQSRAAGGRRA